MSELDYPGWRAWVDGTPVSILRADGMLRAITLAAGSHQITMSFEPASLTWGAVISAFGLACALGWLLSGAIVRRKVGKGSIVYD